jgi:PilZ domain
VRKASGSGKHEEKAFGFGLDQAPAARSRRENRLTCAPTGTFVYVGDSGGPVPAEIHDVSRSGLRLVLEQPIGVGSAVKVEMAGMIAVGEIRYCRQEKGNSFSAGMRIDSIQKRV